MKHYNSCVFNTLKVFVPIGLVISLSCDKAYAQTFPSSPIVQPQWRLVEERANDIRSCRVTWRSVLKALPRTDVDVDKAIALAKQNAQASGASAEQIKDAAQEARLEAQTDIQGNQSVALFTFTRVGQTIRVDIENDVDAKDKSLVSRAVEYYDGTNTFYVDQGSKRYPGLNMGLVTRNPKEVLSHSAFSLFLPQILTGMPIASEVTYRNPGFTSQNSALAVQPSGDISLTRKTEAAQDPLGNPFPALHQLILDKQHLHPISYKLINLLYDTPAQGLLEQVEVLQYRSYGDGVWFPSRVSSAAGNMTQTFTLVKAEFNDDVDPTALRLPAKVEVSDNRFGAGKIASYTPQAGVLPTDAQVKKLLGEAQEKEKAQTKSRSEAEHNGLQKMSLLSVSPIAGILFMLVGCLLWVQSRVRKEI